MRSLGKTLLVFALLHSVLQGQICLLLQVFLDFLLLHSRYVVGFVKFEDADVTAVQDKQYCLEVKHNGTITYDFTIDTGIDSPFANSFTICRDADGYVFGQLPADSTYQVVTADGKVIASGSIAADGSLNIALPHRGIYFLTIGKQSLKLVF